MNEKELNAFLDLEWNCAVFSSEESSVVEVTTSSDDLSYFLLKTLLFKLEIRELERKVFYCPVETAGISIYNIFYIPALIFSWNIVHYPVQKGGVYECVELYDCPQRVGADNGNSLPGQCSGNYHQEQRLRGRDDFVGGLFCVDGNGLSVAKSGQCRTAAQID